MLSTLSKLVSIRPLAADLGLLALRLGIGASMLAFHGWSKMMGGPTRWSRIGAAMENLGITFAPTVWGFLASFAEFGCSILIVLGFLFRPATALLAATMFVAALRHLNLPADNEASGWRGASHALELLTVYLALFLTGPGRYALGFRGKRQQDASRDARSSAD
jgi:putative oxidoreductase